MADEKKPVPDYLYGKYSNYQRIQTNKYNKANYKTITIRFRGDDTSCFDREVIQQAAELAYKVLHLQTYARIDFMADADENVYCLEANTLPGMTPTSLLPQEAQAIGVPYGDLCEWLIKISLRDK